MYTYTPHNTAYSISYRFCDISICIYMLASLRFLCCGFVASSLPAFLLALRPSLLALLPCFFPLPTCLPFFFLCYLPSFLPVFLPSLCYSSLPCVLMSFLPSFLLPSCCVRHTPRRKQTTRKITGKKP